jgi:hypothetical protein
MKIIRLDKIEKRKGKKEKRLSDHLKDPYQKIRRICLPDYLKTKSDKYEGPLFNFVPITFLPHGKGWEVRGEYNYLQHSITIGTGPPLNQVKATENHEIVHSYGLEFRNETLTDRISSRHDFKLYAPAA